MKKTYAFIWLLFLSQSFQILYCRVCPQTRTQHHQFVHDTYNKFQQNPTPATLTALKNCLDRYHNPNATFKSQTLLHRICQDMQNTSFRADTNKLYLDLLSTLITKHHANIHQEDSQKNTALHYATSIPIIEKLLSFGANPNARNSNQQTPLHMLITQNFCNNSVDNERLQQAMALLLMPRSNQRLSLEKLGYINWLHFNTRTADVNAQDSYGATPLHRIKNPTHLKLLIQNKAQVNRQDKRGETILHRLLQQLNDAIDQHHNAKQQQYFTMLAILLSAGADLRIKNNYGKTAIDHPWNSKEIKYFIEKFYEKRACAALTHEGRLNTGIFTTIIQTLGIPERTEDIF